MENYRNYLILLTLVFILFSCESENAEPHKVPEPDVQEEILTSTLWKYENIAIFNFRTNQWTGYYFQADENLEPFQAGVSSFRDLISKRRIDYTADGNYQLVWEPRGDYQLGTPGDENWQPRFGGYVYDPEERTLIHNPTQPDETEYFNVVVEPDLFIRHSFRVMSTNSRNNHYMEGDEVLFYETFYPVKQLSPAPPKMYFRGIFSGWLPIGMELDPNNENQFFVRNVRNIWNGDRFSFSDKYDFSNCNWEAPSSVRVGLTGTLIPDCRGEFDPSDYAIFDGDRGNYDVTFNRETGVVNFTKVN